MHYHQNEIDLMVSPRISPVLGVRRVRPSAEYYRDVLGFDLDPINGIFQPTEDEPDGVYGIVKKNAIWIHFQIRRSELQRRQRPDFERDIYLYVDDVKAEFWELSTRGANIIQPLSTTPYGLLEFTIEDLNGFRLSFGSET